MDFGVPLPSVIVADDSEIARERVVRLLRSFNLQNPLVMVGGKEETFAAVLAERPALVIMDLNLAGGSGLDVLALIRNHPRTQKVPVILLSETAEMSDVDAAYDLGVTSYLVKPVGYAALYDTIRDVGLPWMIAR